MNKIVLVDSDAEFLAPLEIKFLQNIDESALDLSIITDEGYLTEYFSMPVSIDILVISEELFNNVDLQKHSNISKIFVITEEANARRDLSDDRVVFVDRYKNLQAQYNIIASELTEESVEKSTKVVLFYSPTGGAGKTTLSLSVAKRLAKEGQRILYINAERINSFQYYLNDKTPIPNSALPIFNSKDDSIYSKIKNLIRREDFDYLPPFGAALKSYNIDFDIYKAIISSAKASNDYDVIIVDTDTVFDSAKQELISFANKVAIVISQAPSSQFAISILSNSVNFNDKNKFHFVCNGYSEDEKAPAVNIKYQISEYINFINQIDRLSIDKISDNVKISSLAYSLV